MHRIILSTVGTSLLTQQIERDQPQESHWSQELSNTANLNQTDISPEIQTIIATLQQRAIAKLNNGKIAEIRRASAELNGIYGIYDNQLSQGRQDIHYLIATDTYQGQITAQIIADFLREQGIGNIAIFVPPGLSTATTMDFSLGIDTLLIWLEDHIEPYRQQYSIQFNLVGGFKSLQGYLNTIGMFYADAIHYIFEGKGAELISIPRLPIQVDTSQLQDYALTLAQLKAGAELPVSAMARISETLFSTIDNKAVLTTWGELIWNRAKTELLTGELLPFPLLVYQDSFRQDYNQTRHGKERLKLQETLAKVSYLLSQSGGNVAILKSDGGLQYDKYKNKKDAKTKEDIDHFRVTQGIRVSCQMQAGQLLLRRYGQHSINDNP
ncbi:hypothetical protein [Synechocystis sp. PCC 7338]|uniref:hypothetical protein n=1 Tax=Synechocystis sp. PCC 7338 TaxID=2732530 RepID=UPI001BAF2914|nr:hypothetical protein [Synechocystis sp. PCC 7338]QUS62533.1 CRISPR-associated protein [Synechocystis sp. PCC 7338]